MDVLAQMNCDSPALDNVALHCHARQPLAFPTVLDLELLAQCRLEADDPCMRVVAYQDVVNVHGYHAEGGVEVEDVGTGVGTELDTALARLEGRKQHVPVSRCLLETMEALE